MNIIRYIRCFFPAWVTASAVFVISTCTALPQTKQLLTWQEELNYLQSASGDDLMGERAAVVQIRNGVEFWLKLHPFSKIGLKPAPQQPWGIEEIRSQVSLLRQTVESILKEAPGQPFNLGVTEVSVTAEASPLSPMADSISRSEIVNREAVTAAAALDYVSGVSIDHVAGRNEAGIRLRGFSNKGQVPLYLDGIPIQVPYDGTIDFNRFMTGDIAEIQVAKGFSSPLLGPNGLGGSISFVTRQPQKPFEAEALIGTGSGDTLLSSLHLGSNLQHFYFQGSVNWLQRDFIPLSGNFPLNQYQRTDELNQSDSRDEKYSGRIAWTPAGQDQYVFSYTSQKGEKGNPIYSGSNPSAVLRYWRWPYWNKDSYYFISNTSMGESSSIRFRVFYDQFQNGIDMFDDGTYRTMNAKNSEHSIYDDHADGASSEFTTRILPRNAISASFFFKDDTHKEYGVYPGRPPFPLTTPTLLDRDQQFSIGAQDVIALASRLRATAGFSADYMKGLQAQVYNSASTGLMPLTCISNPGNTEFSGCTARVWNYNPQASLSYTLTRLDTLYLTFSDRGRFPLLKESYSYRLGTAIPNPDLKPEHSRNWTVGLSHAFGARTLAQIDYFRSDFRDAIESVYIQDPGSLCPSNTGALAGYCNQNVNIGKEVHEGVEFNIRSTPTSRLTLDMNYSYLNRNIAYDFAAMPNVSQINTSIVTLPTLPKNKVIANGTLRLLRGILAIATFRYEGGITLQDTTYRSAPGLLPYGSSYGTVDLGTVAPIHAGISLQAGVKNLFDRNYYYTAGYPEPGRNWFFNLRYRF
jgi:iron complex outermembrane receptor protein